MAKSARLTLRAATGELERLRSWLESLGQAYQLSDRVMFQLDLCLTELVTNVINYAYPVASAPEEAVAVQVTRNPANLLVEGRETHLRPAVVEQHARRQLHADEQPGRPEQHGPATR